MKMVNLTINNKQINVPEGTTILEAAGTAGIKIPTLCFHKRLNPIGSCRMCVVDIEGCSEPMASCTTPVTKDIIVTTDSDRLLRIRQESLKLILVNHPLDCPICDKGGECQLQDLVYEFGIQKVSYKTNGVLRNTDYATPLIRHWAQRCIMCLRCVSACREIKGLGAIDVIDNGYDSQISPVNKDKCESCGECLSVCPTGAITENLSRYKGRPWMVNRVKTTCTYCGCGCQLELNVMDNRVIAVTTTEDRGTNKGSLCVKGRFGYEFIGSDQRLQTPLIKENGEFRKASWDEALTLVADRFSKIKKESGPDAIAALSSARCTNEENYLFQKFMRAVIGTNNVDHCARL
jgi:predicted molibdopterin-dependent oxidoreductase YjgC